MKVNDVVRHKRLKQHTGQIVKNDHKNKQALVYWPHLGQQTWMPFRTLEVLDGSR